MLKLASVKISRRGALKGAAAAASVSAVGAFPAWGQASKKIVLSTWGGDYAKLLTKAHLDAAAGSPGLASRE
jgi:putative spermidine/putrescine transport system substrate-binding protein